MFVIESALNEMQSESTRCAMFIRAGFRAECDATTLNECRGSDCPFYKTRQQLIDENLKRLERLRKLPYEQIKYYENKYNIRISEDSIARAKRRRYSEVNADD